jgi:RNA polymerase sigma-70 factor (ECF subfamily)
MSAEELIRSCSDSKDGAAWEEFVSRFRRPVSLSIMRTAFNWGGVPSQVVDDLVQETYLKLFDDRCRLVQDFAAQHPEAVVGYIKTIAVNVAHDYFKSLHCQKRGSGEAAQSLGEVEPTAHSGSLGGPDAMEREILLREIDACLETCTEGPDSKRDRLIFWLHYQQGMSAKAIAALPTVGLTAKGVESVILRLTRLVREQIVRIRSATSGEIKPGQEGFRPAESY